MLRLVIDIDCRDDDMLIVKEIAAVALEPFGKVNVASAAWDGKEKK